MWYYDLCDNQCVWYYGLCDSLRCLVGWCVVLLWLCGHGCAAVHPGSDGIPTMCQSQCRRKQLNTLVSVHVSVTLFFNENFAPNIPSSRLV